VSLVPTCVLTPEENAAAEACARWFHPLVRFDATAKPPALDMFERIVGARRVSDGRGKLGTFFLQGDDTGDERYLTELAARLPAGAVVTYALDYFARNEFTVQVFLD